MSDKKQNQWHTNIQLNFPLRYCYECGFQIDNEEPHANCMKWGIMLKKYKTVADWQQACLENGKRVASILKIDQNYTDDHAVATCRPVPKLQE
jgi:hypothetical protein